MKRFLLCSAAAVLLLQGCASEAPKEQADTRCIRDTGTRLEHSGCLNEPGRSYSREDLQRTGEIDNGQALKRLDPSIH